MFARLHKLIAACRRSRALAAILVPAFLLATMPYSACICADGHKESSCNSSACCDIAQGNVTGVCCGCSCCKPGEDGKPRSCCHSKHRLAELAKNPISGLAAKTGPCCNPVVEVPAPTVSVKQGELPSHKTVLSGMQPALQFTSALPARSATRPLDHHHGPPPLDAVIVFLHLTI